MSTKSVPPPQLRQAAEARLAEVPPPAGPLPSAEALVHELQVHQIELEMQNEALRLSQVALEESRDRYVDLYEFAPVGYISLNNSGLITGINLTGAGMFKEDRSKLLGRRFMSLVVAEDKDRWQRHFNNLWTQPDASRTDLMLQRRDGRFDVCVDCRWVMDGGLRIALTDISELKRILAELRTSETSLRLAKNAAGLGIYDHDVIMSRHYWDEKMRQIWGLAPSDPVSYEAFMAGVHPEDRPATQIAVDKAFDPKGSGEYSAEYRVINRIDGCLRNIAANGRATFDGGRLIRFTGTVRDISAQKQQEKLIQTRRAEMELLNKQQVAAQTVAAIAHELNQPLVAISAYSEAALHMLRDGAKSPEKLDRALQGAMEQAQRAGRTLHELFGFLRQGEIKTEPVDLNQVVQGAVSMAAEDGYGGFSPLLELEPDLRPVLANRLQLQKVVINLLHNGVDAMRAAGVSGAAITIRVRTLADKNLAQVTVQDSGPGLDAETARRIFDPFFTTKPHGIGLGLAISRALIEAHGGQLWLDLQGGTGATFHFNLPFAP